MKAGTDWGRWLVSGIGSITIVGASLTLFRNPGGGGTAAGEGESWYTMVDASELRGAGMVIDPSLLYLPNPWSAQSSAAGAELLGRPVDSFQDFSARRFFDSSIGVQVPLPVDVPNAPIDTFRPMDSEAPFLGLGRQPRELPSLPERAASIEVARQSSGERMLRLDISGPLPEADSGWQAAEFLLRVGPSGIEGTPALLRTSGVPEIDRFFSDSMDADLKLGLRLRPGIYRVKVGR
jgi:hypothetical protein